MRMRETDRSDKNWQNHNKFMEQKKKGTVSQCLLTWVYLPEYLLVIWHLAEWLLTKRLPFLGWVLFSKPNKTKTKLSCLLGEPQCERVGPLHDLKLKMKLETQQRTKTNTYWCLNPWTSHTTNEFPGQLKPHRRKFWLQGCQGDWCSR